MLSITAIKLKSRKLFIIFGILIILTLSLGSCIHEEGSNGMQQFLDCPDSPNCVSSLEDPQDQQHYILPYKLGMSDDKAFTKIIEYLESHKNVKIINTENGIYIHAVFTSKLMRFKDDVEFRIHKDGNNSSIVDIRSASRVGYSDLGVNRKRMEELRKYFGEMNGKNY